MEENINKNKVLTISDYINILIKYKKFILIFSLSIGLITAFIVFVILDPIFLSKATVKTTVKSSGLSGLLSGTMAGLSDFTELGGGASYRELALYENILISRRCIEETIIKYNLNAEWDFKYMQDAVKYFRESVLELSKDKVAGTMDIGIYDKDPQRAKEMVEFLIYQLNRINAELNVTNAKSNREFIEARYEEIKENLKRSEDSLKIYQEIYGIAPDIQAGVVAQTAISIEVQIKSEELKLDLLRKILTSDQPEIKAQENKLSILKEQLNEIRNSVSGDHSDFLKLKNAPENVMNFLRLKRDVEIQNKILAFILPVFEQAKIDEKRETPTVILLDYPVIPEKKSKPRRLTVTAISLLLAFGLSSIGSLVYDKAKNFTKSV